jgi:CheY-like chemotaxis protein
LRTILLVDDDLSILIAWKRLLRLLGYCVETAADGVTGMALVKQIQPDLIITDRSMPGMSGIDFCHRLRCEPRLERTPLVLATAEFEFAPGTPIWDDLWKKPVSVETMRESIQRLLT